MLRVVDGDTVVVSIDLGFHVELQEQHVRVAHINAPEIATAEGKAARDFASTLLRPAMLVRLASHSLDKYGRILGTIGYPQDPPSADWNTWPDFGDAMLAASMAVPYEGGAR